MECILCHEETNESRKVLGQGQYWPGMSDEERAKVANSVTIIPCHDKCYDELSGDD